MRARPLILLFLLLTFLPINVSSSTEGADVIARVVWEYRETPDFFSNWGGDADRLPNGNTLITDTANGRILEVTPEGEKVWELILSNEEGIRFPLYRSERLKIDLTESALYNPEGFDTSGVNISVTVWNPEKTYNGTTFTLAWGHLLGINMAGQLIWKYEGPQGCWMEEKLVGEDHLLLWGLFDMTTEIREIDLDGNIFFQHREKGIHHDVIKISEDKIMYLYQLKWWRMRVGDEIRVMDTETHEILWTWNAYWYLPWNQYCEKCLMNPWLIGDWTHCNSLTFRIEDGKPIVYLSVRNLNQIVKINGITKKIIWKLGENGHFVMFEKDGTEVSKLFSHQHDPEILPNGNILLFDNGEHRGGENYSRVIEIEINIAYTNSAS